MANNWTSLYLFCGDVDHVQAEVEASFQTLGYEHYNPFGNMPGKAYPLAVRLFIAPAVNGWTRLIGTPDEAMPAALSRLGVCLLVSLDVEVSSFQAFQAGAECDPADALTPYLKDGISPDDLQAAFNGGWGETQYAASLRTDPSIPMEALPDDVKIMAQNLKPKHINNLFDKLLGQFGSVMKEDVRAARQMLDTAPRWDSDGGQRITAVMDCLPIPDWQTPNFVTLRDAYQLHIRRQRNPNAMLYPGDTEAMDAVPDALRYIPVYGGKML